MRVAIERARGGAVARRYGLAIAFWLSRASTENAEVGQCVLTMTET